MLMRFLINNNPNGAASECTGAGWSCRSAPITVGRTAGVGDGGGSRVAFRHSLESESVFPL